MSLSEEQFIKENMGLVHMVALRHKHRCTNCEYEDLVNAGMMGLHEAFERFDPSTGFRMSTYATHYIRGYIKRYLRDNDELIHIPAYRQGQEDNPRAKISLDRDADTYDWELPDHSQNVIDIVTARQILDRVTDREAVIIDGFYAARFSDRDLGRRLGISGERVKQIRKKTIARLSQMLEAEQERLGI